MSLQRRTGGGLCMARMKSWALHFQIRIIIIHTVSPFRTSAMHTLTVARTASSTPAMLAALPAATSPTHGQLDSADLLQGQKAVSIVHNGSTYRLQATKLGKLILTK